MRALPTVALVSIFSVCAHAEEPSKDAVNLAEVYGQAALVGMQLTIQKKASEGTFPSEVAACMTSLPSSTFNSVFDTALKQNLDDSERASATAFFSSPAGQKYSKTAIVQLYRSMGVATTEPMPEFSTNEYTDLAKFTKTSAGDKLIMKKILEGMSAHQEVGVRVQELLHSCNDKVAKR